MGYSIAIRCRSIKIKEKMSAFLEKNYRTYLEVLGKDKGNGAVAAQMLDDLSYDHAKKTGMGFDYSSWMCEEERYYLYTIIRWMAIKAGHKQKFISENTKKDIGSHPFYVYDGCEKCPIIITPTTETKGNEWAYTDQLGWKLPWGNRKPRSMKYLKELLGKDYCKTVVAELKRLNDLWLNK